MPQLQVLYLGYMFPGANDVPFMTAAELAALISACPALNRLDITGALLPGDSCDALLQLPPACCKLLVGGEAFDDSAAATVAQLTQLTSLSWKGSGMLTDAGLCQLTALRGLHVLFLENKLRCIFG